MGVVYRATQLVLQRPANVLVDERPEDESEHVYLTDFGIARQADSESIPRTATFVGTVDYTAPERLQGGKGDAASDIYSFGCVPHARLAACRGGCQPASL